MSRIAVFFMTLLALRGPSLVAQGLTPASVEAKLLTGSVDPLTTPSPDNKKKYVQWLFELPDPASVITDLKRLDTLYANQEKPDHRWADYNPVVDLLDLAQRPLLTAVLAWKPALAGARDFSPSHYPSAFPFTLAVRRDDLALCMILLASGAKAENNESDPEGDDGLTVAVNSDTFAGSEAMKAFLVQAGARTQVGIDEAALSLDDRVRVRKSPVDGETLGYLSKGEKVRVSLVSTYATKVGDQPAPWYKVATAKNLVGWVWGGLLRKGRLGLTQAEASALLDGRWNDGGTTGPFFHLELVIDDTKLIGFHEAGNRDGSRVDEMPSSGHEASIVGKVEGTTALVSFTSGYSPGLKGEATLTLRPDGKLAWKILRVDPGEQYLPAEAVLVKLP